MTLSDRLIFVLRSAALAGLVFCLSAAVAGAAPAGPPRFSYVDSLPPATDYKTLRLREMADMWIDTPIEDRTIPLLAMLLTEDGPITAERRHDCRGGTCYAVGLQGHNICTRGGLIGTPAEGRKFCHWAGGKSPLTRFEETYPAFATDWRVQFAYYTTLVRGMTEDGIGTDDIIRSWNPRKAKRRDKVRSNEPLVREALGF